VAVEESAPDAYARSVCFICFLLLFIVSASHSYVEIYVHPSVCPTVCHAIVSADPGGGGVIWFGRTSLAPLITAHTHKSKQVSLSFTIHHCCIILRRPVFIHQLLQELRPQDKKVTGRPFIRSLSLEHIGDFSLANPSQILDPSCIV